MPKNKGSVDPAAEYLLEKANHLKIQTGWDRFAMQKKCIFGAAGLCCRNCLMGPCRINPSGAEPSYGVCGISPDGIVARNLCRMIVSGAAAHSEHAVDILNTINWSIGSKNRNIKLKDLSKLQSITNDFGYVAKDHFDITGFLVTKIKQAFTAFEGECEWLTLTIPVVRLRKLRQTGLIPCGIDSVIRETLHRTNMGVDADPINLLTGAFKCSLADFAGMDIASVLADIFLGTPQLTFSEANLGILDPEAVNIAVHGHNPLIIDSIIKAVPEFEAKAKRAGATHGINIVGICCTGHEVLMRHGIPLATNAASQELAILTGAIEAMVVDVQCVMPSLANICECYHTQLITTMPIAKIPGARHLEFVQEKADESAGRIIDVAIESFRYRNPDKVDIPPIKYESLVGFSLEAILSILKKINSVDPLQVFIDLIKRGEIRGIVLLAGCNNYEVVQDSAFITIAEKLAAANVLIIATGCAAGAFAKKGFLSPLATKEICGDKLKELLYDLGNIAGLNRPLPPIWHMGSCIDNSRAARLSFALADKLNADLSQLPIVISLPEAMSEKVVAIGTWAVTLGLTTHFGITPPVTGGKIVSQTLTETVKDLLGAYFIFEPDPVLASRNIISILDEKRKVLGFNENSQNTLIGEINKLYLD